MTKVNQNTPGCEIRRKTMVGEIHTTQYGPTHQRYYRLREGLIQTDEQLGIRKDDGKRQE